MPYISTQISVIKIEAYEAWKNTMLDLDRLIVRFRQFGGLRLAWQYVRMGLLWPIIREMSLCVVKRRSFKRIYGAISAKVDGILVDKYRALLTTRGDSCTKSKESSAREASARRKTLVWWCWLQGEDKAPALAKACLESLRRNLTDAEIVVITAENYKDWATLPEHVIDKYERGIIPHVSFSDLLRLALLLEHGGVWIDSTVLCTGTGATRFSPSWEDIASAELFVFQYTQPGQPWSGSISNWFIASQPGTPLVRSLLAALCAYWRDHDCLLQYYIFHLFFAELAKAYPDMIARMPYGWSVPSIRLGGHLGDKRKEDKWQRFTAQVHWHKMTYRKEDRLKGDKLNYYSLIIREYGECGASNGRETESN